MKFLIFLLVPLILAGHPKVKFRSSESSSDSESESSESNSGSSESEESREHHQHPKPPAPAPKTPSCPPNWRQFQRSAGLWCIQVFWSGINRYDAESQCQALGATLTGFDSLEERAYVQNSAIPFLQSTGIRAGSFWIGLVRRPSCYGYLQSLQAACRGSQGFMWTDGVSTRQDLMNWRDGMPDNAGGNQNCVFMLCRNGPVPINGVRPERFDDIECVNPPNPWNADSQKIRGYACGKFAQ
ncbi:unnamed protein product [Caenorhabditis angaria]|uniref:C-type lectin domain-containing protein n=1 Tax=Caenorhabditis angaria TaxID=860376 RepID=A0A9P1IQT2_9PELO|nr:unnamed protein product [Caenorhabditis angaria]